MGVIRPALGDVGQITDKGQILALIDKGFRLACDRFTQQIERKGEIATPQTLHSGGRLLRVRARDKAAGHRFRPEVGRGGQQASCRRKRSQEAKCGRASRRQGNIGSQQVFFQMAGDRFRRFQGGQSVHKPEQFDLEFFVGGSQSHQLRIKIIGGASAFFLAANPTEQSAPPHLGILFQVVGIRYKRPVGGGSGRQRGNNGVFFNDTHGGVGFPQ